MSRDTAALPAARWRTPTVDDLHSPIPGLLRGFWRSHLTIGFSVQTFESLAMLAYLLRTPHGTHRGLLMGVAVTSAVSAAAGLASARWIAGRSWRARFWLFWTMAACLVMAIDAHLDGGLASPLLLMSSLPVMSAMSALSPRAVTLCGGVSLGELATVVLADPILPQQRAQVMMLSEFVVGAVALAVASTTYRFRLESRQINLLAELRRQSETDGLTGCLNQRAFHERLSEEIDRAVRYGRPLSVLMCDVDMFKAFNDNYGHPAGDDALCAVGANLRSAARSADVVGRIGGDEFALIMPETTLAEARTVEGRIKSGQEAMPAPPLSISVGIAQLASSEPTSARLLRDADMNLYGAKAAGRPISYLAARRAMKS